MSLAAENGHADLVDILVHARAEPGCRSGIAQPKAEDWSQIPAISLAVTAGHLEVARALCTARADPCAMDSWGYIPLQFAAGFGRLDLIATLVAARASPSQASGPIACAPLTCAAES